MSDKVNDAIHTLMRVVPDRFKSEVAAVKAGIERYEKALKFYANRENYEEWNDALDLTEYIHSVDFDCGDTARKALGVDDNGENQR